MSITPQRVRNKTETESSATKSLIKSGNWSKCFPTKFSTETSSCVFVKKLLTVAISNITYLRSIFPENAYANRSMDGLPLKILRGKNECEEAQNLANWLMGAFDALEKKYLRELMLIVYKDPSNPNIVQEMYTFKFSYPDGQATCEMLQGEEGRVVKNLTTDDIYRSTQNLLRTLIVLTQGLAPLSDSMMTMKLTYYDAVTPGDYEPIGFCSTPMVEPQLPGGATSLQSGKVETNFHSVQLRVKAVAGERRDDQSGHTVESVQEDNPAPVLVTQSPAPVLSQQPSSSSLLYRESQHLPSSFTRSQALSSVSLLSEQPEENLSNINCICCNQTTDPLMLVCYLCTSLQHAACYRIVLSDMAPVQHCCVSCSMDHGVPCTDTKLVKMSTNPAVTLTCLFRRALAFLLEEERVALEAMMDRLGVEEETAGAVLQKLAGEGCLIKESAEWVVQKEQLVGSVLPRYMGKGVKRMQGSSGEAINIEGKGKENNNAIDKERLTCKDTDGGVVDVIERKEVKCSTVASPNKPIGVENMDFDHVKGLAEGGSRRSKRRKISCVKENLSI